MHNRDVMWRCVLQRTGIHFLWLSHRYTKLMPTFKLEEYEEGFSVPDECSQYFKPPHVSLLGHFQWRAEYQCIIWALWAARMNEYHHTYCKNYTSCRICTVHISFGGLLYFQWYLLKKNWATGVSMAETNRAWMMRKPIWYVTHNTSD